jgi:hypothetical protein
MEANFLFCLCGRYRIVCTRDYTYLTFVYTQLKEMLYFLQKKERSFLYKWQEEAGITDAPALNSAPYHEDVQENEVIAPWHRLDRKLGVGKGDNSSGPSGEEKNSEKYWESSSGCLSRNQSLYWLSYPGLQQTYSIRITQIRKLKEYNMYR